MKHFLAPFTLFAVALLAMSCSKADVNKDVISPEELFRNSSMTARTTIHTKGDAYEDTVTTFPEVAVYRKSDKEGQSWFVALSGGKMVYDLFMLSIYFGSIDDMKVGDTLKLSRFMFSFFASSDFNATTYDHSGTITLANKGDDFVILRFNKVSFNCSYGKYVTDGYLYCPLYDEYTY